MPKQKSLLPLLKYCPLQGRMRNDVYCVQFTIYLHVNSNFNFVLWLLLVLFHTKITSAFNQEYEYATLHLCFCIHICAALHMHHWEIIHV